MESPVRHPPIKEMISSISTCSSDQYKPIHILVEVFLQQMHDPYYRSILLNCLPSRGI